MENLCQYHKKYIEPNKKYNVVSTVLFIIEKSYKDPIKRYILGLDQIVNSFRDYFDDSYYLRIYYDKTLYTPTHPDKEVESFIKNNVTKLLDKWNHIDYVQLVEFECSSFKIGLQHKGLFGTLIRFYPLFDFEDNVNIDTCVTTDVDISLKALDIFLQEIQFMNNRKYKFLMGSARKPLETLKQLGFAMRETVDNWGYAGHIISTYKFPSSILINFLEKVSNNHKELTNYFDSLQHYFKTTTGMYEKTSPHYIYSYGIDEFFLNYDMLDFYKKTKQTYVISQVAKISLAFGYHRDFNHDYKNLDKALQIRINIMYQYIFQNNWGNTNNLYRDFKKLHGNSNIYNNRYAVIKMNEFLKKNEDSYKLYGWNDELLRFFRDCVTSYDNLLLIVHELHKVTREIIPKKK